MPSVAQSAVAEHYALGHMQNQRQRLFDGT